MSDPLELKCLSACVSLFTCLCVDICLCCLHVCVHAQTLPTPTFALVTVTTGMQPLEGLPTANTEILKHLNKYAVRTVMYVDD